MSLDEKGAVGDSDSYTELLSSVPSRDDVNIFDAGVRYGIFHHATGSAGADLIFVQNNAVTLPSSKIFRIHYFTDNSSGVIESTDLYISFIDQFEAGSLERSRGVRGEFQTIQACTTVVPDEWRW